MGTLLNQVIQVACQTAIFGVFTKIRCLLHPERNCAQGPLVYCTSPFGLATNHDEGESWDYHEFPKLHEADGATYCHGMVIKADNPEVMFVDNGDTISGVTSAVRRTRVAGKSWEPVSLPVEPNSHIYGMVILPSDRWLPHERLKWRSRRLGKGSNLFSLYPRFKYCKKGVKSFNWAQKGMGVD